MGRTHTATRVTPTGRSNGEHVTKVGDVEVPPATRSDRHTARRISSDQSAPRHLLDGLGSRLRPATHSVLLWAAAVGITILLQWHWLVLYLDIRYTFGALRSGGEAGLSAPEVFIHRPMAHKLLMSWLDHLTFGPTIFRERLTVSIAIVFAGIAGAGLARVLRVSTAPTLATCIGLATFTALAWAPTVTILQPEWLAALLCVGALSLGLARSRHRAASWSSPLIAGAGLLLAVAALQKYTTATTAIVTLGVLFVLHRWRAWMITVWTAVLTLVLLGVTLVNSHEWQWLQEVPRLNPPGGINWQSMWRSLWNLAWLNPVLMLLPAAVILGFRLSRRRIWIIGTVLAVIVVMAGVIVQRGFFPYHYGALPVLAAGLVTLACGQGWQQTGRLPHIALVALVWLPFAGWLVRRPFEWRVEYAQWVAASVAVVILVSSGLAVWQTRDGRMRSGPAFTPPLNFALTAIALALVTSFSAWPNTPYALYQTRVSRVSEIDARARSMGIGRAVREAAGGASVVYLARQDAQYVVGLPTGCRYPAATFLYRSARVIDPLSLRSVQENLACLRDPSLAFLVLQPAMMDPGHAVQLVRDTVAGQFDCDHPTIRTGSFVLCPRR